MFSCFTQLANKDNYNYDVTYCDYEGATYEYDDGGRMIMILRGLIQEMMTISLLDPEEKILD